MESFSAKSLGRVSLAECRTLRGRSWPTAGEVRALHTEGIVQTSMQGLQRTSAAGATADLLVTGRVLQARVLAASADRAVLLLSQGMKLEVLLQTRLEPGQRVRLQVVNGAEQAAQDGGRITLKFLGETAPLEQQPAAVEQHSSEAQPQLVAWLRIPLQGNRQGWAQLSLRTERDGGGQLAGAESSRLREVHLWWETPELGEVGVTLTGAGKALTVGFQVRRPESLQRVAASLSSLEADLKAAGFPNPTLACRPLREGEKSGPVPAGGLALDRRL